MPLKKKINAIVTAFQSGSSTRKQRKKQVDAIVDSLIGKKKKQSKKKPSKKALRRSALYDDDESQKKPSKAALRRSELYSDADESHKKPSKAALRRSALYSDADESQKKPSKAALRRSELYSDDNESQKKPYKAALRRSALYSDDESQKKPSKAALRQSELYSDDDNDESDSSEDEIKKHKKKKKHATKLIDSKYINDIVSNVLSNPETKGKDITIRLQTGGRSKNPARSFVFTNKSEGQRINDSDWTFQMKQFEFKDQTYTVESFRYNMATVVNVKTKEKKTALFYVIDKDQTTHPISDQMKDVLLTSNEEKEKKNDFAVQSFGAFEINLDASFDNDQQKKQIHCLVVLFEHIESLLEDFQDQEKVKKAVEALRLENLNVRQGAQIVVLNSGSVRYLFKHDIL